MARLKLFTALATLAVVLIPSGGALADPYADEVVIFERLEEGFSVGNLTDTPDLTTSGDDGDDGSDAVERTDFVSGDITRSTTLGFDERSDTGGSIILAFTDNLCMDDLGADIEAVDIGGNESGSIEVSNDGGQTFAPLGDLVPGSYRRDAAGAVDYFDWVLIRSKDVDGNKTFAGFDLDGVLCLNSLERGQFDSSDEGCDLRKGDDGLDIKKVITYSDGSNIFVDMTLCAPITGKGKYTVSFDFAGSAVDGGPDSMEGGDNCSASQDAVAIYQGGPVADLGGAFAAAGDQLSFGVAYDQLGRLPGDDVMIWIETREKGVGDLVPNAEEGDRCASPQSAGEALAITLL